MSGKEDKKGEGKKNLFKTGSRVRIINEANQCWSSLLRCKECQKIPPYFNNTPGKDFYQWSLSL